MTAERLFDNLLKLLRRRHDCAAALAGAEVLRFVEILVGARHRVGLVVVDHVGLFVQEVVAARAIPVEAVNVASKST